MRSWKSLSFISLLAFSLNLSIAAPSIARSLYPELRPALDDRVKGIMARQNIPGMAVVVIKDGLVLEMKGYGVTDRKTQNPVSPNTKFAIASMTKSFTGIAAMLLVEDGKLDLDAPISQYLTDLPRQWEPLTMRQLLGHTSGISENYPASWICQPRDLIQNAKRGNAELDFPPGGTWSYSNTGSRLAGLVIAQVSGQSYGDFLRDRVFQPLGMTQTQAKLATVPGLATGYQKLRETPLPTCDSSYASGNIISTAIDLTKWAIALDQGKLLKPASYQQLWTPIQLNNGRRADYGLGWHIENFNDHPSIGHGGNTAGYSSGFLRYPNDRLSVLILTNNVDTDGTAIANQIASVYEPSVSITNLKPQTDPDPAFTQRFLALLQGDPKSIPLAPEYEFFLKTERGKYVQRFAPPQYRKIKALQYLREETRNGDRIYYYKIAIPDVKAYASIVITPQGQVANYEVKNSP
jgi:D-alanyl-D-alanine carboxypeptidase